MFSYFVKKVQSCDCSKATLSISVYFSKHRNPTEHAHGVHFSCHFDSLDRIVPKKQILKTEKVIFRVKG